ncbi:MAG TPA: c-type cytochrome domain-containing protein, partial [Vicinamibacterales bacterium]|nr:c-type cytochrome domain-containing protein [Vicinamibacterales bacterium]
MCAAVGAVVCLAAALLLTACASRAARVQAPPPEGMIGYQHVQAIFRESCEHCHNEDKARGGLVMTSFDALIAGGESGPAYLPGQSASSPMVQMLEGTLTPRMPYKEDPLS